MKRLISHPVYRAVLPLLAAVTPAVAIADTHWLCSLSEDLVRVVCVADFDGMEPDDAPVVRKMVRGVRYPLDRRQSYVIDIYAPPDELARVEQLAKATICMRDETCHVTFSAPSVAAAMSSYGPSSMRRVRWPSR